MRKGDKSLRYYSSILEISMFYANMMNKTGFYFTTDYTEFTRIKKGRGKS